MEIRAEISITEIQEKYGIKPATAYKWRSALRNLNIKETWENYDRINSREINLSEAAKEGTTTAITVVENSPSMAAESEPVEPTITIDSGFGLNLGRLQELNSEAELEVLVRSKLRDYHENQLQTRRSVELKSKIAEVTNLDPKNLGAMLSRLGVT
jgi:hypothetical protein